MSERKKEFSSINTIHGLPRKFINLAIREVAGQPYTKITVENPVDNSGMEYSDVVRLVVWQQEQPGKFLTQKIIFVAETTDMSHDEREKFFKD